ncbi:ATP-binding cassette domain-containing protein [Roseovarius aestuariivivens]|uniref:thiamine ABC transporter ATP-binding protein n=1 Tax=Roseovarius aestuariivivens TaxID=1888910 RepID=UPI0010822758|nr:ATP-binding cassette domain-containing protein [Roseovarius aestuariivivens]
MLRLDDAVIANGAFRLQADLEIPAQSKVAVIGPSGAGKSTLIEAIAGFLPVETGHLLWNGREITNDHPSTRPVAMLFQDGNLFQHLTLAQNVALGLHPDLRLSPDDQKKVDAALDRVGLAGFERRKPADLSGGQRSRAALARVLVQRRGMLLLDEPFAALGPALRAEMLDLVSELVSETSATLLMVSHDPQDARRITNLAVLVAEGRAAKPVDTEQLLNNPPPVLRKYLG